jgi:hypothetical protein
MIFGLLVEVERISQLALAAAVAVVRCDNPYSAIYFSVYD